MNVIALLAAALVLVESLGGEDGTLKVDSRLVGVGAAGVAIALRGGMVTVVTVAAVAAALARAIA